MKQLDRKVNIRKNALLAKLDQIMYGSKVKFDTRTQKCLDKLAYVARKVTTKELSGIISDARQLIKTATVVK